MDIDDMKEYICDQVGSSMNIISHNKKVEICKILKNKIPSDVISSLCFESSDGTRINLDDLSVLENYENIIKEIYNIVYYEINKD